MVEQKKSDSDSVFRNWTTGITLGIILFVGILMVQHAYRPDLTNATEDLVKCLNKTGAVMYGASWCHFCQQQKTMLSPYFEYITFVDCDSDREACVRNGVTGYPTWIIYGKQSVGLQSAKQLAEASGCRYNE